MILEVSNKHHCRLDKIQTFVSTRTFDFHLFSGITQVYVIFSVNSSPPLPSPLTDLNTPPPHIIMDMQKDKRRNFSTHVQVNFSQSETSSLLRAGS